MQGIEQALTALASADRLALAVLFLLGSLALLAIWWKQRAPWLLLGHLALVITSGALFAIALNCALSTLGGFLAVCSMILTNLLIYILPPALGLALITGTWLIPAIYRKQYRARPMRLGTLDRLCARLGLPAPRCYALDTAKPLAFTAGNAIHLSTGLTELLTPRQLEAVLAHELHHVQKRHSFLKLSTLLTRMVSPVAAFTPLLRILAREEQAADDYAAHVQGTGRHLLSAKRALSAYEAAARH